MIRKLLWAVVAVAIAATLWWQFSTERQAVPEIDLAALQRRIERDRETSEQSLRKKVEYAKELQQQRKEFEGLADLAGAEALLVEIDDLLEQARREQLEAGSAIRLLAAGELHEVLPLDEEDALKAANPIVAGRIEPDAGKIARRRDAMVSNALKQRLAVIILGGGHDLGESVDRIGRGRCEYLRVTTTGYRAK